MKNNKQVNVKFPPRIDNGLCGGPRIEPLAIDEFSERGLRLVGSVRALTGYPADAPIPEFFSIMCKHADMFDRYMEFGMNFLHASEIPPRERELVILRTGWLCDAPYEWGEHVVMGQEHGLTAEEIERVKVGPEAEGWSDLDRALLNAVDELHDTAMICDETWAALAAHFDDRRLLELPVLVGHYHTTAFLQNAIRFRPGRDKFGQEVAKEGVS